MWWIHQVMLVERELDQLFKDYVTPMLTLLNDKIRRSFPRLGQFTPYLSERKMAVNVLLSTYLDFLHMAQTCHPHQEPHPNECWLLFHCLCRQKPCKVTSFYEFYQRRMVEWAVILSDTERVERCRHLLDILHGRLFTLRAHQYESIRSHMNNLSFGSGRMSMPFTDEMDRRMWRIDQMRQPPDFQVPERVFRFTPDCVGGFSASEFDEGYMRRQ